MKEQKSYNPLFALKRRFFTMRFTAGLLICCIMFSSFIGKADTDETIDIELSPIGTYDEVPVEFSVNGLLKFETEVIITESNRVYINIEELFRNLGIKCVSENGGNLLSGYTENENTTYSIDFNARQIKIKNKTINSTNGLVKESGAIYVETTVLTEAFGLSVIFNYRYLSIKMDANFELPLLKQMRLEQMRQNVSKLQGNEFIADTIVKRNYHLFKFGTMDWSINSYQTINESNSNVLRLGVGTELLYGQVNLAVYYNDRFKWDSRSFYYDWRWVDNEKKIIKQVNLGKIPFHSIAFINSPLVGGSINNSPNTVRKASGYYTINEYTEPNWTVELYINDVLVDFTVADASGLFVFKVPNVYGYTTLTLKFYGPMGEERIEERTRNLPYTFLPAKTLEYSLTGGILEDGRKSRFMRGDISYGVNRFITVGGGVEYLSRIANSPFIPFAKVAVQPFSRLLVNFEYAHNVLAQGLLSYNFGESAFLEIDYTDYVTGQTAVLFKPDEELKARLTVPFKLKKFSGFAKLKYNQFIYDEVFDYHRFDAAFSGYYKNFNASLSGLINWVSKNDPYVTSTLALSYKWKNGLVLRPMAEYNIGRNELLRCKVELEQRIGKANFTVSYERNFTYNTDYVFAGFRYDLKFARVGVDAYYTNDKMVFTESAQGSLAFGGDKYVKAGNTPTVGRGGILFYPFLDMNQNDVFDKDERLVLLSSVKVSGGKATINEKDYIVRVGDLNSFVYYNVEFNDDDLENIGWQFKHKTYQVLVDPNQFKRVDVPIVIMGEANGMVYKNIDNDQKGIGRITIQIFDKDGNKVAETLSESDGYLSYLGLKPGAYKACVDPEQLQNINLTVNPLWHEFTIKALEYGDIVYGLNFVLNEKDDNKVLLQSTNIDTSNAIASTKPVPVHEFKEEKELPAKEETTKLIIEETTNLSPTKYIIQLGAFGKKANAEALKNNINTQLDNDLTILEENDLYKLQVVSLTTIEEVNQTLLALKAIGITNGFVITLDEIEEIEIDTPKPVTIPEVNNSVIEKDTISQKTTQKEEIITVLIPIPDNISENNDTSTMRVHENSEEVLTSDIDFYAIQLGAFKRKTNAYVLRKKLIKALGKRVDIFVEGGFYKVRIAGFESREEIDKYIPVLVQHGVYRIYINKLKGIQKQQKTVGRIDSIMDIRESIKGQDTVYLIVHEIYEEVISSSVDSYAIQIGAFNNKSNAFKFKEKLTNLVGKSVDIFYDEGYYKVRISGFRNRDEVKSYTPTLLSLGVNEIWVTTLKGMQKHMKVSSKLDTIEEIIVPPEKLD